MAHIHEHVHIARPPEDVYALLTDLGRLHQWTPAVISTEDAGSGPLASGRKFRQRVRVLGAKFGIDGEVTACDPPRVVEYRAEGPRGARATMRQHVIPEAEGCRVEVELDYDLPGGRVGDIVTRAFGGRVNERVARVSLTALKELAERT